MRWVGFRRSRPGRHVRQAPGQNQPVEQRLTRTLPQVGGHGVRGVAEQCRASDGIPGQCRGEIGQ